MLGQFNFTTMYDQELSERFEWRGCVIMIRNAEITYFGGLYNHHRSHAQSTVDIAARIGKSQNRPAEYTTRNVQRCAYEILWALLSTRMCCVPGWELNPYVLRSEKF